MKYALIKSKEPNNKNNLKTIIKIKKERTNGTCRKSKMERRILTLHQ